jgi:hypothetical protein
VTDRYTFVRDFLADFYLHQFTCGRIKESDYYRYRAALNGDGLKDLARDLFDREPAPVLIPDGAQMRLIRLREMDGTEFPFVLGVPKRSRSGRRSVKCFVGHRFIPEVENRLRTNLAHLLKPYRIDLEWSAVDISASDVFKSIIKGIHNARMCFFDNFGTEGKPNVYIEIGIACALKKPAIVAEYVGDAPSGAAPIPSDLQGLFRIQYKNYHELFRKLYFHLPNFIADHGIMRARK